MHAKKEKGPRSSAAAAAVAICMVFLLSCSGEQPVRQPQQADAAKHKKTEQKAPEKAAEKQQAAAYREPEYTYDPNGKVDPFMPLITSVPSTEKTQEPGTEKQDVPLTPLQKLDIEDFKLVAVVYSDKSLKALLEDPAMNGFIVQEGMRIGKNDGVIRKILNNSVIVEEQVTDQQGNTEKKIQTLTLKKK